MTRQRLVHGCASLAAAFGVAGATAAEDAPPCVASVALEPDRAVTGQQILFRLRLLSREAVTSVEWIEPPSFPGFRAERLPARPQPDREVRGGVSYRVREEIRALFAERPGSYRLRGSRLRCRVPDPDTGFEVVVPDATLVVVAPPESGRPPGFGGLVGPLTIRAAVEPRAISLGESVRLRVVLQGSGNVWDAPDPLSLASENAEVFRQRPAPRLERGSRLFVRMRFDYDLVPRSVGTLRVPAIRLPYFDPDARSYAVASAPSLEVSVAPPAPAPGGGAGADEATGTATPTGPDSPGSEAGPWLPLGLALAAGGAVAVALVLRRRSRRAGDAALAAAAAARARGDREAEAAALARALREGLAELVPAARSATAEEIVERASAPVAARAARLLAAVDRARFDPRAATPDRAEVERALGELRRRGRRRAGSLREWLGRP